jgi:hypothetical protein
MKAYWGNGGIDSLILTSALDGGARSALGPGRFTLQEERTWYPMDRRLGAPQTRQDN